MFSHFFTQAPKRIYLDFAAATPVHKEVVLAMQPYLAEKFGNPSAIHAEGQIAREAVEKAREDIARTLRVRAGDVTFTSGGTEANNLGILGTVDALHADGRALSDMEIITTRIEHPSIMEAVRTLGTRGVSIQYAPVNDEGRIIQKEFDALLSQKTVLVVCSYVNSEIGVVQDVKKLSRSVRKFEEVHGVRIPFFLDAAQAPLWLPCQLDALGADMLALDTGKCYGPKGVGVLVHRAGTTLVPQSFGGSQEKGFRAGTENVPLIVGAAVAIVRAQEGHITRSEQAKKIQDEMFTMVAKEIPEAVINGAREHRVPNNVNISLVGFDSEFAVVTLDAKGIAASTRSACSGADGSGSYVVREIADDARAASTIRFTFGEETTLSDVQKAIAVLKTYVAHMHPFAQKV